MKKLLLATLVLVICATTISAKEMPIKQGDLPKAAQSFIMKYYPKDKITTATVDRDLHETEYEVRLSGGAKLEFDSKGEWTQIESARSGQVPKAAIMASITKYVESNFRDAKIVKIERDKKSIEVDLSNGKELEFNLKGEPMKPESKQPSQHQRR